MIKTMRFHEVSVMTELLYNSNFGRPVNVYQCINFICFCRDILLKFPAVITHSLYALFQAVTKMIQEAFTYVGQIQDMDTKLKLIDTLISVTAGKVHRFVHFYFFSILQVVHLKMDSN